MPPGPASVPEPLLHVDETHLSVSADYVLGLVCLFVSNISQKTISSWIFAKFTPCIGLLSYPEGD